MTSDFPLALTRRWKLDSAACLLGGFDHFALVIAVALVARAWRRWREPRRNQSFWAPKDGCLDTVRNE
jgi:hypothetical protein